MLSAPQSSDANKPNELPFSELAKKIFEVAVIVSAGGWQRRQRKERGWEMWEQGVGVVPLFSPSSRAHTLPLPLSAPDPPPPPLAQDSKRMGMNYITPEQLLASLLSASSPSSSPASSLGGAAGGGSSGARRLVETLGASPDALRSAALAKIKGDAEAEGGRRGGRGGGSSSADAARAEGAKVLAELTRDLTAEAAAGHPDPVIGRTKEVCRCVQILARRSKNNPILLGEPGVGKV